jgi:perosamine synthetase
MLPLVEPWIDDACAEAVRAQVASGFLGPGETCRKFAEALTTFTGAAHAVSTTSGTVALSVAAIALGLKPGEEIAVPAYGVISTINAFAVIGLVPRLVDIDPVSGCMDPDALRRRLRPQTKAVCFVNFSGHTGLPLVEVAALCAERGLPLIEDAACALGSSWQGRKAGSFGTIGTLSFSVPKIVTTGQGGALLTNSAELRDKAAAYIDHGDLDWRRTNLHRGIGTNLRFNDVSAALGLAQMEGIQPRLARKRAAFGALRAVLGENLYSHDRADAPLHNIVFSRQPDHLVTGLRAAGFAATRQYRCLTEHPAYAELADISFPVAELWSRHAVYLPFGLAVTAEQASIMAGAVLATGESGLICTKNLREGSHDER